MKLLLDTHAMVWWWLDDPRLPSVARAAIANPDAAVLVSAASAWEVSTKHRLGKWPGVARIVEEFEELLRRSRFSPLPVSIVHAALAGSLAWEHRDPFDRMLAAQARMEQATLVSADPAFRLFGADVMWS